MGTLQDSSERISGVVGEVRQRARHSNDHVPVGGGVGLLGLAVGTGARQRPKPFPADGPALRRPGGDRRQCRLHLRPRLRHPERKEMARISFVRTLIWLTLWLFWMAWCSMSMISSVLARTASMEGAVQGGRQYREDSDYISRSMEAFHQRADRLRTAMDEIAGAIASISSAIDGAASGITGAAGSTRVPASSSALPER